MIVTEEEAKTKWCPEVRSESTVADDTKCIGSVCMAWRWYPREWINDDGSTTILASDSPRVGWCGKAGKP